MTENQAKQTKTVSLFWSKHDSNCKNIENFNGDSFWKRILNVSNGTKKISYIKQF